MYIVCISTSIISVPTVYLYTYYTILNYTSTTAQLVLEHAFSLVTGIADEGFEMLEQLAYLYLANNKVSPTLDFQMWI